MLVQNSLNEKYAKLCQTLGDLEFQKFRIEKQINDIRQEISTLNSLVPELVKLEKLIAKKAEEVNKIGAQNE